MNGQFTVTTFSLKKRKRALRACNRCKKLHKKCLLNKVDDSVCISCSTNSLECIWSADNGTDSTTVDGFDMISQDDLLKRSSNKRSPMEYSPSNNHKRIKESNNNDNNINTEIQNVSATLFSNDRMYADAMNKGMKSQFVISTHPLAPLFSRDSFLSLDGDFLGLFYPWKDFGNIYRETYNQNLQVDRDLMDYLDKKKAFELPTLKERKRLIDLFLKNVYPLYPVVDRAIFQDIKSIPLILINAIMLSAIRYDTTLEGEKIRTKAAGLRRKCKLLEMLEISKVILIQSFLLITLDEEGPEGASLTREYASRAVCLCAELGLHNVGAKNAFDLEIEVSSNPNLDDYLHPFELTYKRPLLTRLFWTSFCVDRLLAVTSCSAMNYDRLDLIVPEKPLLQDFDQNEYQLQDYQIFDKWYSICLLFERVIMTTFRPPKGRVTDDKLEIDIEQWQEKHLKDSSINEKFQRFFKLANAYCGLLYLKSKINFIALLTGEEIEEPNKQASKSPLTDYKMKFFGIYTSDILRGQQAPKIEQILSIHALVHVLVLLQLEIEARTEVERGSGTSNTPIKNSNLILGDKKVIYDQCIDYLDSFKYRWWFSAAAHYLYKEMLQGTKAQ